MKKALLSAKHCKETGIYYGAIIPPNINEDNYLDFGVPFKFGFINSNTKYEFPVPEIRTVGSTHIIHTFRDLDIQPKDRIRFDHKHWEVQDVSINYVETSQFQRVKHYFITIR